MRIRVTIFMIEVIGPLILTIVAVLMASIGIGIVSEKNKYQKIIEQVEKEVPNYESFLPEYRVVDKIPEPGQREKGVKYFNDADLMERVKYVDLKRILAGERTTITDTPMEKITIHDLVPRIYEEARIFASDAEGQLNKELFDIEFDRLVNKYYGELNSTGGVYLSQQKKVIVTEGSITDEAVFPHEDTHALMDKKVSKTLTKISIEKRLLESEEKKTYNEIMKLPNDVEQYLSKLSNIQERLRKLPEKMLELNAGLLNDPKKMAINEGLSFALTKFYSGWNPKDFDDYIEQGLDPKEIEDSRGVCSKLLSLIGPESTKHIVIDVMNEAYKNKEDAVELLKRRADSYFGKEKRINQYITERTPKGMLGIFSEMIEHPENQVEAKKFSLEEKLAYALNDLNVASEDQESIRSYLQQLKNVDEATYEHSIRVGLKSAKIAKYQELDPKAGLFTGVLHDAGKMKIDPKILKKKEGFSKADMEIMKAHAQYTYDILSKKHAFSAAVGAQHHRFQGVNSYPEKLPELDIPFSDDTKNLIKKYAEIVALADTHDAMTTRENDKFGKKEKLSAEQAKKKLLKFNPDKANLIEELYKYGVFVKISEN